jgi:MOSC domain-containing protein YiiM
MNEPSTADSVVLAIALRTSRRGPMREVQCVAAEAGRGLAGDLPTSEDRGITLLADAQWRRVVRSLRTDLPWHTRRANVLVRAEQLGHLIGRTIEIGEVRVCVADETRPCGEMDRQFPGLKSALTGDCAGGVHGRILNSGVIQVGDRIHLFGDD